MVWSVALFAVFGVLDINLGPLIAGAGIVGIAIGFGAQSFVKDVVTGIFMLAEDQYGVGDIVDLGEAKGTVEKVSIRSTRLRDVFGVVWYVPNGEIRRVANKSQEWARALLDVSVSYDADIAVTDPGDPADGRGGGGRAQAGGPTCWPSLRSGGWRSSVRPACRSAW